MTLNETKLFARSIADISNEQQDVKQNISGNDEDSQLQLGFSELVEATGSFVATAYLYPTAAPLSFILDHPIYGELDSPSLYLDGGYMQAVLTVPVTMPVTLGIVSQTLYSTTF